jgi:DNA-binding response OmpR family regulator
MVKGGFMHILVLDDDELLIKLITRSLQLINSEIRVTSVMCQKDAFDTLDKNDVDLAIVDRHVHGGCLVGLRAIKMGIRTILCTGDHSEAMGFKEVLLKPFTLDELEHIAIPVRKEP